MSQELVVARALPRHAQFHARSPARLDAGESTHAGPALNELRLRDVWEQRIGRGVDRVYIASLSPPYQAIGYAVLLGSSYDVEPVYLASPLHDEQLTLDALRVRIEIWKTTKFAFQVHPKNPEVPV